MRIGIILLLSICCANLLIGQVDTSLVQDQVQPVVNPKAFNLGIQVSPTTTWLGTNDNTINGDGDALGMRIGLIGEKYFQENYAIMGSFSVLTSQGGTLKHDTGGNLWPTADLSNPDYNNGQKPLPDGTRLSYNINYLEFALGLKLKTNAIGNARSLRIYAEVPTFSVAYAIKSRGDIDAAGIKSEDENVRKEINNLMLTWGAGAGVELTLKNGIALVGGVSYMQSLTDVTRDKGTKAFNLIDDMGTPDPTDDTYETQKEDARVLLNGLNFRIGVYF